MTSREEATFILLGLFAAFALAVPSVRSSIPPLLKALFFSKVTVGLAFYVAAIVGATLLARAADLWTSALTAALVLWLLFTGFKWFVSLTDAGKDDAFFRRRLVEAVGLGAFLEFFVNLETLPLVVELILQASLAFIAMTKVVADATPEYRSASRLLGGLIGAASLGLVLYTGVRLAGDWATIDKHELLSLLLMPIWLTLVAAVSLYLIALYMGYELLFVRLGFMRTGHGDVSPKTKLGVTLALRGNLIDINGFNGQRARDAVEGRTIRSATDAVAMFRRERAADEAARALARRALVDNAGVPGVDAAGLTIDRREFAETKDALRWLATCHMGRYRNEERPNEYRPDLLEILGPVNSELQFPDETPIVMNVRTDRQAWYAYRRTPSGHYFGIGALGPPPSQWLYDSDTPPGGYPTPDSDWTSVIEGDSAEWCDEPET